MDTSMDIQQVLEPGLKLCYSGGALSFVGCGWAWLGQSAPQIGALAAITGAVIAIMGYQRSKKDNDTTD